MPHQSAELHALIYAWKDMVILLPALEAVIINQHLRKKQRDAVTHLLYLQRWMRDRKSPLSPLLKDGVSDVLSPGRSGLRQGQAARRGQRKGRASVRSKSNRK